MGFTIFLKKGLIIISTSYHTLEGEEWKDIEGFDSYQISNFGRVFNKRSNRLVIQSFLQDQQEYRVTLNHYGKKRTAGVHRLVAEAFLPNYQRHVRVVHKDGVRTNNHISNLEMNDWVIRERQEILHNSQSKGKKVRVVNWDKVFPSVQSLASHLGTKPHAIYKCLRGEREQHLGLTFEVVDG